ncbi:MAG: acetoacetate decarboxylase family protein [Nocardioidaceae bacterium]
MSRYPPSPWQLHGHAYVGLWLVPRGRLPRPRAPGTRAITVGGYGLVAAAFVRYTAPSPLEYDEVMTTVLVRRRWRPAVSITHIWVDSPASRDGGRELWGIPKEIAAFEVVPHRAYAASEHGRPIARVRPGEEVRMLPWRLPLALSVSQCWAGRTLRTPVRGTARLGLVRGGWAVPADGAAGFLAGRRPLVTLAVRDFRLSFGR